MLKGKMGGGSKPSGGFKSAVSSPKSKPSSSKSGSLGGGFSTKPKATSTKPSGGSVGGGSVGGSTGGRGNFSHVGRRGGRQRTGCMTIIAGTIGLIVILTFVLLLRLITG